MKKTKRILRFLGFIIFLLFLRTTLSSDVSATHCSGNGGTSTNSCSVSSTKTVYLRTYNQFSNIANFDYNNCAASHVINSLPPYIISWSALSNLGYWIIVSVSSCDGNWKSNQRFCFPSQTFHYTSAPPTGVYSLLSAFTPSIYWDELGITVPSDKDFTVTLYVYSNCDVCNLNSASLYRHEWSRSESYSVNTIYNNRITISHPLHADYLKRCDADC